MSFWNLELGSESDSDSDLVVTQTWTHTLCRCCPLTLQLTSQRSPRERAQPVKGRRHEWKCSQNIKLKETLKKIEK